MDIEAEKQNVQHIRIKNAVRVTTFTALLTYNTFYVIIQIISYK